MSTESTELQQLKYCYRAMYKASDILNTLAELLLNSNTVTHPGLGHILDSLSSGLFDNAEEVAELFPSVKDS